MRREVFIKRPRFPWTRICGASRSKEAIEEGAGADGAAGGAGPLAPEQRWSVGRKRDVVLRLRRDDADLREARRELSWRYGYWPVGPTRELDRTDMRIRLAGMDIEPGWVPGLGSVALFHYGNRRG